MKQMMIGLAAAGLLVPATAGAQAYGGHHRAPEHGDRYHCLGIGCTERGERRHGHYRPPAYGQRPEYDCRWECRYRRYDQGGYGSGDRYSYGDGDRYGHGYDPYRRDERYRDGRYGYGDRYDYGRAYDDPAYRGAYGYGDAYRDQPRYGYGDAYSSSRGYSYGPRQPDHRRPRW